MLTEKHITEILTQLHNSSNGRQQLQKRVISVETRHLYAKKNTNNQKQPSENCVIYTPIETEGQHQTREYEGDCVPNIPQDLDTVPQIDLGNEPENTSSTVCDASNNSSNTSNSSWLSRQLKKVQFMDSISHGGSLSSGLNLASATLGAGTLGLPYAMSRGGTLFGSLFLCLCCAGTVYAIRLLVITLELTGCSTYEDMALVLIGRKFKILTVGLIVLFCWGATIVYVVAICDLLKPIRELDSFPVVFKSLWGKRLLTTIFWAIFMLPLSLAKEINTLRYASMIGVMSIVYLAIAIVIHNEGTAKLIPSPAVPKPEPELIILSTGTIFALPIIIFAYVCQTNCFEIYAELKDKSVNRMTVISAMSMGICTVIYITVGLAGVYDFRAGTKGNILSNYEDVSRKPYLIVAFVSMAIALTISFPILLFPARDAVLQIIGYKGPYDTPTHIRVTVAGTLAVGSLVVGLFVPQITILFGLLGSISGSTLSFIWPGIFILRTGKWNAEHGVGSVAIAMTWALIIGGAVAALMGTAVSIYEQSKHL